MARGRGRAKILLVGYDPVHKTPIGAGENGGVVITEVNVVRAIVPLGTWQGAAVVLHVPHPAGLRAAVILQTETGAVLGLAQD